METYPKSPEPVRLEIEPTNACNSHCIFCPRHEMDRKIGYMNIKKFRDFLDRFKNYREKMWLNKISNSLNYPSITFCGLGEPLLHPEILNFVSESHSRGFKTQVTTNGNLLNEKIVGNLVDSGLDELAISLHSLDPIAYRDLTGLSLDDVLPKITKTLKILKYKPVKVEIWRVTSPDGKIPNDSNKFNEFISKFPNVRILGPTPAWNRGGILPHKFWPLANDGKIWCEKLYFTSSISWDGRAVLCCCDYFKITVLLGNAWKEDFETIQNRKRNIFKIHTSKNMPSMQKAKRQFF